MSKPWLDEAVDLVIQLAQAKSETGAEHAAVVVAGEAFSKIDGSEAEIDRYGNVLWTLEGASSGPTLLIDAHVDSIPLHSSDRWSVDPFGGEMIDGRIYGLGLCDQRASIAAMAIATAELVREGFRPKGRLVLVGSASEEQMEGVALRPVVERFEPQMAVTTEPTNATLMIGQRGRAKLEVEIVGRACHAGHASEGRNALSFAASVINWVGERYPQGSRSDGFVYDVNCIDLMSSPYPSVSTIPGGTLIRFDARFGLLESKASLVADLVGVCEETNNLLGGGFSFDVRYVRAQVRTWSGYEQTTDEFAAAWLTDSTSDLVSIAQRALVSVGLSPRPHRYSFCTNGSLLAGELGIPTIGFGVGEESLAHQVDEHVTIDSIARTTSGLKAMIGALLS